MKYKRLLSLLQSSVEQFKKGEDAAGIDDLMRAVDALDNAVENDRNLTQPRIDLGYLLAALEKLHFYMKNQDITGMTDLLEKTFYPMAAEWFEGCEAV